MMQLDSYLFYHVSGQRQTGLEKKTVPRVLELNAHAVCVFCSILSI